MKAPSKLKFTSRRGWRPRNESAACYEVRQRGKGGMWLGTIYNATEGWRFCSPQSTWMPANEMREIAEMMESLEVKHAPVQEPPPHR